MNTGLITAHRADVTGVKVSGHPEAKPALGSARTIYSERLHARILKLRKRGLVPTAIADALRISDSTVTDHLRRLVAAGELDPTPYYLDQTGPKRERALLLPLSPLMRWQRNSRADDTDYVDFAKQEKIYRTQTGDKHYFIG